MMQYFWCTVIVLTLLAMSVGFGWRQIHTLRWLRTQEQMSRDERHYFRRRCFRRLVGCGLTAVLAVLISGLYLFSIMDGLDRLVARGDQAREAGVALNEDMLAEEDKESLEFGLGYLGFIALVLFLLMLVAFVDTMATRRFGMRLRKRIRDDRQAMLQRQLPLLKRSRNGHQ